MAFYPWKKTVFAVGVAKWKREVLQHFFREYNLIFIPTDFYLPKLKKWFIFTRGPFFIIWGRETTISLKKFALDNEMPVYHMEDGFVRSIGLGASHILPYSIVLDKTGLYYDASSPSDLEIILNTYDFDNNKALLEEAKVLMYQIRDAKLTKYNHAQSANAHSTYGKKMRSRILVVGQVENDQSIQFGCESINSNLELINLAIKENPTAEVIYKPHPDVLAGFGNEMQDVYSITGLSVILKTPLNLCDALHEVDRVYTLTSLAGFESLMHGIPVTTVGLPFYAGWGLTDDRQKSQRRKRTLSLEAVFAGAYILYPRYMDPNTMRSTSLSEVILQIQKRLSKVENDTLHIKDKEIYIYNYRGRKVNSIQIDKKVKSKTVVIFDNEINRMQILNALAKDDDQITCVSTTDAGSKIAQLAVANTGHNTKILSLNKIYNSSIYVNDAEKLAQVFSGELNVALRGCSGNYINQDVIDGICLGFSDRIYNQARHFYCIGAFFGEYDTILASYDNINTRKHLHLSTIYHAQRTAKLESYYYTTLKDENGGGAWQSKRYNQFNSPSISNLDKSFSSLWINIKKSFDNKYAQKVIAVCGDLSNKNYAYSPSTEYLISSCSRLSGLPVVFFSTQLLPHAKQEIINKELIKYEFECRVYNGNKDDFQSRYPIEVWSKGELLMDMLRKVILYKLSKKLSWEIIDIFRPCISKYMETLLSQIIFTAEADEIISHADLFATAVERNSQSRIIAGLASSHQVCSIAIQPQIISTSPRYKASKVDKIGVIDHNQKQVFESIGTNATSIEVIGSINVLKNFRRLDQAHSSGVEPDPRTILFAMQHSCNREMISISRWLKNIAQKNSFNLIIKPHPHQEEAIIYHVKDIYEGCDFVQIYDSNSDTYKAISMCKIVVGLYSNVLLESAIWGKSVIVAALNDLDPSVDFSLLGIALKAIDESDLEKKLIELLNKGPAFYELNEGRDRYMDANPQFRRPFDTKYMDNFIAKNIQFDNNLN